MLEQSAPPLGEAPLWIDNSGGWQLLDDFRTLLLASISLIGLVILFQNLENLFQVENKFMLAGTLIIFPALVYFGFAVLRDRIINHPAAIYPSGLYLGREILRPFEPPIAHAVFLPWKRIYSVRLINPEKKGKWADWYRQYTLDVRTRHGRIFVKPVQNVGGLFLKGLNRFRALAKKHDFSFEYEKPTKA